MDILLFTIPLAIIHFIQGVVPYYYIRSYILLFSVFVFILTMIRFLQVPSSLRTIFRILLNINIFLVRDCLRSFFHSRCPWPDVVGV